jgi:hypothetical protein
VEAVAPEAAEAEAAVVAAAKAEAAALAQEEVQVVIKVALELQEEEKLHNKESLVLRKKKWIKKLLNKKKETNKLQKNVMTDKRL